MHKKVKLETYSDENGRILLLSLLRRDFRTVLTFGMALAALSFAIGYVTDQPLPSVTLQPTYSKQLGLPQRQTSAARTLRTYKLDRPLVIGSEVVRRPAIMAAQDDGSVDILDWHDLRIKSFSSRGKLLRILGEGRGVGPGRFQNPTAFAISGNGELWVCDPPQQKVTRFNAHGKVIQELQPRSAVDRIAIVGSEIVTKAPPGAARLFEVYNSSGTLLTSFGEMIRDQPSHGIALDGYIIADSDQSFVYGTRYAGMLSAYSPEGELKFFVETIDRLPLPKVVITGDNRKIYPDSHLAVLSMSILDDQLYVLSGSTYETEPETKSQIVDVYSKFDGSYLLSFGLPIKCKQAIFKSDRIYTLDNERVTLWHFSRLATVE